MIMEQLLKEVEPFLYVSFDLFDTLLFRTFQKPEDVFEAVEYAYNNTHSNKIKQFCRLRHAAEIKARKQFGQHEITIKEIYNNLQYEKKVRDELEALEKKIEIENCLPNKIMIDLLRLLQSKKKYILITTDMYLDKETIESILDRLQVENYLLFLSSDMHVTKISGQLFPLILDCLGIKNTEMVHIGDNPISDLQRPREIGIQSYERLKPEDGLAQYQSKYLRNNIAYRHLCSFVGKMAGLASCNGAQYRIGFSVLGPIATEFCIWIHKKASELKCDKILFVAREGYLLQKIYIQLFPEEQSKTDYIYLNKNLLRFPALYLNASEEQLMNTIPMRQQYSVRELLSYLFIDHYNEFLSNLSLHEIWKEDTILTRRSILKGEYSHFFTAIFDALQDDFQKQYNYLIEYLQFKGTIGHDIILVNNSINGNGQILLESVMKEGAVSGSIYGMQFVRSRKCRKVLKDRAIGWMTDGKVPLKYTMAFNRCALLFEHFMFEPAGTALYFKKISDTITPVCAKQGKEKENNDIIKDIQGYALDFAVKYQKNFPLYIGEQIMELLLAMFEIPYFEDVELMAQLYDDDSSGSRPLLEAIPWDSAKMILAKKSASKVRKYVKKNRRKDSIKAAGSAIKSILNL